MIIKCPHCNNDFEVSTSESSCSCPSCGLEVTAESLIADLHADSDGTNKPEVSVDSASKENPGATNPKNEESLDTVLSSEDSAETSDASDETASDGTAVTETEERPFLDNWKTGGGMFALGFFASFAIGAAGSYFNFSYVLLGISIAYIAFIFVYALWIYPSLFTATPKLKSSRTASFLNGFCGSLIFGALWNLALNNKEKGVSQYVLIGLNVIGIGLAVVLALAGVIGGGSGSASLYSHPESLCQTAEAKKIVSAPQIGTTSDPNLRKITFGYLSDDQYSSKKSWYPSQSTGRISRDATVEIVLLAMLQMFNGDSDAAAEAMRNAWTGGSSSNTKLFNQNSPSDNYTGMAITEGYFYIGNARYMLMLMFVSSGGEITGFDLVTIERA